MSKAEKVLPTSRIYSFLDNTNSHTVHFLEGQKLIHDLVITHSLNPLAFSYFRDTILGAELLSALLKPGEILGLFVDSENPYFRLKIEVNDQGQTRALVYPESFQQSPKEITGQVRLTKIFSSKNAPYTSILKLDKSNTKNILNIVLKESYQVDAEIKISDHSDQSLMMFKLPLLSNKIAKKENLQQVDISPTEYWIKIQTQMKRLFTQGTSDEKEIVKAFQKIGLTFLGYKEIEFQCNCNRERMLEGIKALVQSTSIDQVFEKKTLQLESRCDYCRTNYIITREELSS